MDPGPVEELFGDGAGIARRDGVEGELGEEERRAWIPAFGDGPREVLGMVLAASFVPAWRASRLDPVSALREE